MDYTGIMHGASLTKLAIIATLHCLSGCAIGEVLGSVIGSGLGWSALTTECLTIPLAFLFGYAFTMRPLINHGIKAKKATKLALASDTLSIATMELVDTAIIVLIPGALAAGPTTLLFWASLAVALFVAFICATPVNRYLIARGKGHAVLHDYH
jgi:hypothetical protein